MNFAAKPNKIVVEDKAWCMCDVYISKMKIKTYTTVTKLGLCINISKETSPIRLCMHTRE